MKKSAIFLCTVLMALPFTALQAAAQPGGMMPPDGKGGQPGMPGGKNGQPGMQDEVVELTGAVVVDGAKETSLVLKSGGKYKSTKADECVMLVLRGGKLAVADSFIDKSGDSSNVNGSNFSGQNAAVAAAGGSSLRLVKVTVTSDAEGANAVFSTGDGSVIEAKDLTIHTKGNSSRGLDATYNGTITAENVDITTEGAHCAALATDRGEGTVSVTGGRLSTAGDGSPLIYSTGKISVENVTGKSTGSEIAVIEGKNSINIDGSELSCAKTAAQAVMLYQSMSGDAGEGTSVFTAKDSTLHSESRGPFFYVTNTSAVVNLSTTVLDYHSDLLVNASGNDASRNWGRAGSNGGRLVMNVEDETLNGNINCDSTSSVRLNLGSKSSYTGAVDPTNNGYVTVKLAKDAVWIVGADSYIYAVEDDDTTFSNIRSRGFTVYYDKTNSANKALGGKTYKLPDGGKLVGIKANTKKTTVAAAKQSAGPGMGQPGMGGAGGMGGQPPAGGMPGNGGPGAPDQNMSGSAAEMNAQASIASGGSSQPGNGNPPQMPRMETITGKVQIFGKGKNAFAGVVTADGKQYALAVMTPPDGGKGSAQGSGQPPAPPSDSSSGGKREPPKQVTLAELNKLEGKIITFTGFTVTSDKKMPGMTTSFLKEGAIVVFDYAAVKK